MLFTSVPVQAFSAEEPAPVSYTHLESGELSEDSVVSKMETTAADGKRYQTNYYNLDAIIAVGYRVNSKKATMFRIWANKVLKEFIIKGYVMDDARLREPESFFGKDYFCLLYTSMAMGILCAHRRQ